MGSNPEDQHPEPFASALRGALARLNRGLVGRDEQARCLLLAALCGEHVLPAAATLEHIVPLSEGGNSHQANLAISHEVCNGQRHAKGRVIEAQAAPGQVARAL